MSRMFHRVLASSVIGAAALAAPMTAMAADVGGGGGASPGAETPTAIVVHLPKHVDADEPVTVSARVTPQPAAQAPSGKQPRKGKHKDKSGQGDEQQSKDGKDGSGDEPGSTITRAPDTARGRARSATRASARPGGTR